MKVYALIGIIGLALTAGAQQKPAATAKAPEGTPKATEPAKPADAPKIDQAQVAKELSHDFDEYKLDLLAEDNARNSFTQTDPVGQKAVEILNKALAQSPDFKKAHEESEAKRKLIMDKIDKMRKEQHLGNDWDWNFDQGRFIQKPSPVPPAPAAKG